MDGHDGEEIPRPLPRPTVGEWVRRTVVWIGPRRIAASGVLAVATGVGGWWLLHAPPPPVERGLPSASTTSATALPGGTQAPAPGASVATVADTSIVIVHVAGAVRQPGLVRLLAAQRVADAITAAGGPTADADLDALNLAAPLTDGSRIYVPRTGEVVPPLVDPGPASPGGAPTGPLNINAATAEQFDTLPGVGPSTAAAIVAHREANGPFRTVDDLLDVRGIGPGKLEQFRALVVV